MTFDNVFLDGFDYGSVFGAGFGTIIQESGTGHEIRVSRQAQARHRLSLRRPMQTIAEAQTFKAFGLGRRGSLRSFGVTDSLDNTTSADHISAPSATDVILGTGDDVKTTFQLVKHYELSGPNPYPRTITLPVDGSVVVAVDGVPTLDFTVSGDGRIVLDDQAPEGEIVTAGFRFRVPCRFELAFDRWGALQAEAFDRWNPQNFDVVEVLNEVEWPERWDPGGGRDWGAVTASIAVALNDGCFHRMAPNTAVSAYLPQPTYIPSGDRVFVFHSVTGSAGSVQVRDHAGTAIGSAITAGQTKRLALAHSASTATWVLHG